MFICAVVVLVCLYVCVFTLVFSAGEFDLSVLEDIRVRCCFSGERPPELDDSSFAGSGVYANHRAADMNYPMADGHQLVVSGQIRFI